MKKALKIIHQKLTKLLLAGVFGTVEAPAGVAEYNANAGGSNIGIMLFFSNFLRLFFIIAGLIILYNFIRAGSDYIIHPGDTGMHAKVRERLTMSVLGLVIMVAAYSIASVVGLLFFGDAGFILNPTLYGPQ